MKYFLYLFLLLLFTACSEHRHHYMELNLTKEGRAEVLSYSAMIADINQTFDELASYSYWQSHLDSHALQGDFFEQAEYDKTTDSFIKVQFSFFYDPDLKEYYYLSGSANRLLDLQLNIHCQNNADTIFSFYYKYINTTMVVTSYMSTAYLSSLGCLETPYQLGDLSMQIQGKFEISNMTTIDVYHYDSNTVTLDAQEINEAFALANE